MLEQILITYVAGLLLELRQLEKKGQERKYTVRAFPWLVTTPFPLSSKSLCMTRVCIEMYRLCLKSFSVSWICQWLAYAYSFLWWIAKITDGNVLQLVERFGSVFVFWVSQRAIYQNKQRGEMFITCLFQTGFHLVRRSSMVQSDSRCTTVIFLSLFQTALCGVFRDGKMCCSAPQKLLIATFMVLEGCQLC